MSRQAVHFKVGLFVLVGLALLVAALVALGAGRVFRDVIVFETYVDQSVQGLEIGSPVKYRGVKVGEVADITFVPHYYKEAPLEYRRFVLIRIEMNKFLVEKENIRILDRILKQEIEQGLRVRLAAQGLTGLAYLELDYLDPARYPPMALRWVPRALYVPSAPSQFTQISDSIEKVARSLEDSHIEQIAQNLNTLLTSLNTSVQDANLKVLSSQLSSLLDDLTETNRRLVEFLDSPNMKQMSGDLAGTFASANRILSESEDNVIALTAELRAASQKLQAASEKLALILESEDLRQGLSDFSATAALTRQSAEQLPRIAASLQSALRRLDFLLAGRQQDLDELIGNLRQVSRDLSEVAGDARHYPSFTLFGGPPEPLESTGR